MRRFEEEVDELIFAFAVAVVLVADAFCPGTACPAVALAHNSNATAKLAIAHRMSILASSIIKFSLSMGFSH